uniref:Uncharacterized protein n=1 Tax=Anguilla anguilla TaxID=7936 RepID=A0A0E9RAU7_ANGAN
MNMSFFCLFFFCFFLKESEQLKAQLWLGKPCLVFKRLLCSHLRKRANTPEGRFSGK